MNYTLNVTQDAYSITVEGITEEKQFITPKRSSKINEAAIKRIKGYSKKRSISTYEAALISNIPSEGNCDGWFLYDSTKDMKSIVIKSTIAESAKVDVLIHLLCLHEAINKHWQLYLSDRDRFDSRLNNFIARATKIVGRESIPAA